MLSKSDKNLDSRDFACTSKLNTPLFVTSKSSLGPRPLTAATKRGQALPSSAAAMTLSNLGDMSGAESATSRARRCKFTSCARMRGRILPTRAIPALAMGAIACTRPSRRAAALLAASRKASSTAAWAAGERAGKRLSEPSASGGGSACKRRPPPTPPPPSKSSPALAKAPRGPLEPFTSNPATPDEPSARTSGGMFSSSEKKLAASPVRSCDENRGERSWNSLRVAFAMAAKGCSMCCMLRKVCRVSSMLLAIVVTFSAIGSTLDRVLSTQSTILLAKATPCRVTFTNLMIFGRTRSVKFWEIRRAKSRSPFRKSSTAVVTFVIVPSTFCTFGMACKLDMRRSAAPAASSETSNIPNTVSMSSSRSERASDSGTT